jgi:hypothetical protein
VVVNAVALPAIYVVPLAVIDSSESLQTQPAVFRAGAAAAEIVASNLVSHVAVIEGSCVVIPFINIILDDVVAFVIEVVAHSSRYCFSCCVHHFSIEGTQLNNNNECRRKIAVTKAAATTTAKTKTVHRIVHEDDDGGAWIRQ